MALFYARRLGHAYRIPISDTYRSRAENEMKEILALEALDHRRFEIAPILRKLASASRQLAE